MPSLPAQQVSSPMAMLDVIRAAAPQQAPGIPVELVVASIQQEIQDMDAIVNQLGNTVFITHLDQDHPTMATFRALNADTPQNYIWAVYQYFQLMRDKGVRGLVTVFQDPTIINIAKGVDRMYRADAALGFQVTQTTDGGYRMVVDLGD